MPGVLRFNPLVFGMASEIGEGCDPREALKVVEELSFRPSTKMVGVGLLGLFFFWGGFAWKQFWKEVAFFLLKESTSVYDLKVFSCCDNVQIFQKGSPFLVTN